ncbi:hypothetical protein ABT56_01350 [Photobacterium aquae]|uniref:Carboxyltransferase domain-containing protein n=1 Tax=Photobacterium aquae TaxID=1195763 RepID=A0A0J1HB71_9GAMM|nr:biotin-dependent carboxyltransferase family protein [Photobacterium aquae]KLV08889.1 hypothetical protein ABT56_01350 [Photobacterium aquae]
MPALEVIRPGMLALVQDLGRFGVAQQGLSQGGVLDLHAACWANHLVGNTSSSAVIEVTIGQTQLYARSDLLVAITGADMSPQLDGDVCPLWQSFEVKKGQVLTFGYARTGIRAYIAIRGGIATPEVLGSRSTVPRNQLGGLVDGQALEAGDIIPLGEADPTQWQGFVGRMTSFRFIPDYSQPIMLRVIESYQSHLFSFDDKERFYHSVYTVRQESDRMGCRLSGSAISVEVPEMVSEGIALGAIQFPPDGQPIILLNDRQTLGGYPKIGCVAKVDLSLLAQARPGTEIRFEKGDLPLLQKEWLAFGRFFGV